MNTFDRALGHGPDGATYQPPQVARRTIRDRVGATLWYRFGVGHRPQPRFVDPPADDLDDETSRGD